MPRPSLQVHWGERCYLLGSFCHLGPVLRVMRKVQLSVQIVNSGSIALSVKVPPPAKCSSYRHPPLRCCLV